MIWRILQAAALAAALAAPAWGSEHKIGGKTVSEAFPDTGVARLAAAGCAGDAKTVDKLVEDGVDPNAVGLDGVVPLFWVIHCENLQGIEALLKNGATPNYRIPGRFTLVYQAATYGEPRILGLLLDHGGNPNASYRSIDGTGGGRRAAFEAIPADVERQDWRKFDNLLAAGLDINRPDSLGNTIVVDLVTTGHFSKAIELLDRGYSYDLARLGEFVAIRQPLNRKEERDRARLTAILKARGIKVERPY